MPEAHQQKPLDLVHIAPPPPDQLARRGARFPGPTERKNRYHLPDRLSSPSPIGFRTRVSLTEDEARVALSLLDLTRPERFVKGPLPTERELFEETTLGVLTARQSTNYRGHRQVTFGPRDAPRVAALLRRLDGLDGAVFDQVAYVHIGLSRPYRTPFTQLLTFIGHKPVRSLLGVPMRAYRKLVHHDDDIPTIGYLQHLHVGIWADHLDRAALIASRGHRRAQVFLRPFSGPEAHRRNAKVLDELLHACGLTAAERRQGWRVCLAAQVGYTPAPIEAPERAWRRIGAALVALRSERIQPGVNQEDKAPAEYQGRQDMDVPDRLTEQAGRAAFNAFHHWTGLERETAKGLLLLERIDVLTPGGKARLRAVRGELEAITDKVVRNLPLWADLPTGRALSRNAARGRKAFALAGQRIYVGGLSKREVSAAGLSWEHAVRAFGAAACRGALVAEISGCTQIPSGADLLGGICLMAGPVNQNDIGKQFFGYADLLAHAFPDRNPTSLLVWTLKAKTVADPIGNEEQLLDEQRKGALVDLRPGPHEVVAVVDGGPPAPMRLRDGTPNDERAFADVGNFVTDPNGTAIPGNVGASWPWGDDPAFG